MIDDSEDQAYEEARARFCKYYRDKLAEAEQNYSSGGNNALLGLKIYDDNAENIQEAYYVAEKRMYEQESWCILLTEIADASPYVISLRMNFQERMEWFKKQLEAASSLNDDKRKIHAFGNIGWAQAYVGNLGDAANYFNESLKLSQQIGYKRKEAAALLNLASMEIFKGNSSKSEEMFLDCLRILNEIDDWRFLQTAYSGLGIALRYLKRYPEAIAYLEKSLRIARDNKYKLGEGNVLGNMGLVYAERAQYVEALQAHTNHLELAREIGDKLGEGNALGNIGLVHKELGHFEEAIFFTKMQMGVVRETSNKFSEATCTFNLATVVWASGDRTLAREHMADARALYSAISEDLVKKVDVKVAEWDVESA